MTREERENAIRCLKLWIEKEPYIQTYKTCLEALEQSMPTMVYPQVDGITPIVVAQTDGEKTCCTCRNNDTYHCAECENKSDYEQSQADGEYISRKAVLSILADHFDNPFDMVRDLPSVAIPPDHDGCKDCRWQSQSETEMPCKQCMHNYTDEWERAKIGHWIWQTEDIYQCSECGEDIHVKEVMNEPQYAWCPICGCLMEIER